MTIYFTVLQELINEKLHPIAVSLKKQTSTYKKRFYTESLSKQQQKVVQQLFMDICKYNLIGQDTNGETFIKTDETITSEIAKLLGDARDMLERLRSDFSEPLDTGNTLQLVTKLKLFTENLYNKLSGLNFCLLDMPDEDTPERIVYFHAIHYFGKDIFHIPDTGIFSRFLTMVEPVALAVDPVIRGKKEEALLNRLSMLQKVANPNNTLKQRIEDVQQNLADLSRDNKEIVKGNKSSYFVPGFSGFGVQATVSSELFSPSLGRLDAELKEAVDDLKAMQLKIEEEGRKSQSDKQNAGGGLTFMRAPAVSESHGAVKKKSAPTPVPASTPPPTFFAKSKSASASSSPKSGSEEEVRSEVVRSEEESAEISMS